MLWFKGEEAKVENETKAPVKSGRFSGWRNKPHKKTIFKSAVALALAALIVSVIGVMVQKYNEDKDKVQLTSQGTYFSNHLTDLLDKPPAKEASQKDKLAYYDDLRNTYVDMNDQQKAVETFEKRLVISSEGIDYVTYFRMAELYHKIGNNTKALSMLGDTEKVLPSKDDPETGYKQEDILKLIDQRRKEYAK